jgi:hypothetical protein
VPHFSRLLREVGTTDACTTALDAALAFARLERTLLSVAFEVDFDLEKPRITFVIPSGARNLGFAAAPQLMWRRPPRPSAEQSDAPVERTLVSLPLTLPLTSVLTSPAPHQWRVPHFSRPLREVGTTDAFSAAFDAHAAGHPILRAPCEGCGSSV